MSLKVSQFPSCCGAVVIHNFLTDGYFQTEAYKRAVAEQEREFKNLFRENPEKGSGHWLSEIGYIHITLNHLQMRNEPMILEQGFTRISFETLNKNTNNGLVHYIRVGDYTKKQKKLFEARFNKVKAA